MRVYITGIRGQLGRALVAQLSGYAVSGCDLPEIDVSEPRAIRSAVTDCAPELVIHAAAWTDVDACARDPERAFRVNALGTQNVALACAELGCPLMYISTNEVFDGSARRPYREWESPHPINPYGASKAAGEWYVRHLLTQFYIVRTAWLFAQGGRNFPHRILELAAEVHEGTRDGLRVVDDEVGNPTYAPDLADAILRLAATDAYGVYHLVSEGYCSRFKLACELLQLAGLDAVPVTRTGLAEFERASTPPAFAPLANTAGAALGIRLPHWRDAMARLLERSD